MTSPAAALGATLLLALTSCGEPALTLETVSGTAVAVRAEDLGRPTVWVFITTDCPVANSYAPRVQSLAQEFADLAQFFVVHVDATADVAALRSHTKDYGYDPGTVVVDRTHQLVAHAGVTHTPEAALFRASGDLAYRGRIDDQFADIDEKRPEARTHDLHDALTRLRAERAKPADERGPLERIVTPPVGCPIEDLAPR